MPAQDRIFFSYARDDADFALRLAQDLRDAGHGVWLDQLDIPAGAKWDRAVEAALADCPSFLVVLSPSSVTSSNVMDEVSFALEKGKHVLPVLHRKCEIPFRLARIQYLDFANDYDKAFQHALTQLKRRASVPDPDGMSDLGSVSSAVSQSSSGEGVHGLRIARWLLPAVVATGIVVVSVVGVKSVAFGPAPADTTSVERPVADFEAVRTGTPLPAITEASRGAPEERQPDSVGPDSGERADSSERIDSAEVSEPDFPAMPEVSVTVQFAGDDDEYAELLDLLNDLGIVEVSRVRFGAPERRVVYSDASLQDLARRLAEALSVVDSGFVSVQSPGQDAMTILVRVPS